MSMRIRLKCIIYLFIKTVTVNYGYDKCIKTDRMIERQIHYFFNTNSCIPRIDVTN